MHYGTLPCGTANYSPFTAGFTLGTAQLFTRLCIFLDLMIKFFCFQRYPISNTVPKVVNF